MITELIRPAVLEGRDLHLGYGGADVVAGMDVTITTGSFTVIVGPNACGKSTLLRSLSKVLPPRAGHVLLDGKQIAMMRPKAFARQVGFLAQSSIAPEGITVHELVSRGRYPYQSVLHQWSDEDDAQVSAAMARTHVDDLARRRVAELSGGQRQRVWIAMALAQETDILLLDEPTTYLDIANQLEILDLVTDLNQRRGTTVVMVLHDLGLAARYSHQLVAMRDGGILACGTPQEVVTVETVHAVFGIDSLVITDPVSGSPLVMPIGRHHATQLT